MAGAEDAVTHMHHGHLLQSAGWATLKATVGWRAARLTAGDARAQMLLRRRFGLAAAYVPRGPIWADAADNAALIDQLTQHARRAAAVFLRVEPDLREDSPHAQAIDNLLRAHGFAPVEPLQPQSTIHLDLAPAPERLLAAMSKGHRADIRRAERDGVVVRTGQGAADLDTFYTILQETAARNAFAIHSQAYYAAMLAIFGAHACLWIAEHQGAAHAVAITAAWGDEALYLYSGSSAAGLRSAAQHAIQWQAINWSRVQGAARYDFWGVPDQFGRAALAAPALREQLEAAAKTDPLYGVFRFKKGFGGALVRYLPAYDRVFIPPLYAIWRRRAAG